MDNIKMTIDALAALQSPAADQRIQAVEFLETVGSFLVASSSTYSVALKQYWIYNAATARRYSAATPRGSLPH